MTVDSREIVQSVMDVWTALPPRELPNYAAGAWGPKPACDLLKNDGWLWRRINTPHQRPDSADH